MREDTRPKGEFEEKVIQVRRVSKKTKGGNTIGFSVLVVVGNKKGKVGVALGKAPDVVGGIRKGMLAAKKRWVKVPLKEGRTIEHEVRVKKGGAQVLLKPAPAGSGVIAGGAVRQVLEVAGVRDVSAKILGSANAVGNAYATVAALEGLTQAAKRRKQRGKQRGKNEGR